MIRGVLRAALLAASAALAATPGIGAAAPELPPGPLDPGIYANGVIYTEYYGVWEALPD
ncbi:MAG: hypothetical protein HKO62_09205, partial [Gammaproteobacteria bacterium]|nr:hypothetical protein [Gammaproteobacteria bacterium]